MLNLTIREQLLIALMFLLLFVLAGIWGVKYLNSQEKFLHQSATATKLLPKLPRISSSQSTLNFEQPNTFEFEATKLL